MRTSLHTLAATAALILFGGLASAGCGEHDPLEAYLQSMQQLYADVGEAAERAGADFERQLESAQTDEEISEALRTLLHSTRELFADIGDDLANIAAPPRAKGAHDDLAFVVDDAQRALGRLEQMSPYELQVVLDDELAPLQDRYSDVCLDLQAIANDNNVDVNLECS